MGKPSDREIHDAIKAAALVDPRVQSYDVQPLVSGGFVTLKGRADNPRAKAAAESVARNTVGVLDVRNEIAVVPAKPVADSVLKDRIVAALRIDPIIEAYEMDVGVDDGTVTLKGMVDNHFERAQAEEVAMRMRGVKKIQNQLTVKYPDNPFVSNPYSDPYDPVIGVWQYLPSTTTRQDREIRDEIVEEMTWNPFVDAEEVQVSVVNGKATLTGSVDTYAEKRAATENAFEGGALIVDNDLKIGDG